MLKRGDFVIVLMVLVVETVGMFFVGFQQNSSMKTIEVVHDGKVVAMYEIDNRFDKKFDFYDGNGGHEVYWIHDGGVEVVQSNTPHKICMKMGFIDRNGQMIVALPHKMYITIKSHREENEQSFDSIVQ